MAEIGRDRAGGTGDGCSLQPLHPIHQKGTWQHGVKERYSLQTFTCKGKAGGQDPAVVYQGRFHLQLVFLKVPSLYSALQVSPGWVNHIDLCVHGVRGTSDGTQSGAVSVHSVYPALWDSHCNPGT